MKRVSAFLLLIVLTTACQYESSGYASYKKLMKKEMASGKRTDSLFFGIYLGMTSKDFYTHCWELNKKGIFRDGLNNTAVLYKIDSTELGHPAGMNFYPDFYNNAIAKMRASFQYDAWAPWNRKLFSDTLLPKVLAMYERWYDKGNPFIKIEDKERGTIYVKVDGNRRIIIGRPDDMTVRVDYTDLFVEQEMDKALKK